MKLNFNQTLFPLGRTCATPGAVAAAKKAGDDLLKYLRFHQTGNWGDMPEEDKFSNETAIRLHDRQIFSAYKLLDGTKIWVITEANFVVTTVLLPEDY